MTELKETGRTPQVLVLVATYVLGVVVAGIGWIWAVQQQQVEKDFSLSSYLCFLIFKPYICIAYLK